MLTLKMCRWKVNWMRLCERACVRAVSSSSSVRTRVDLQLSPAPINWFAFNGLRSDQQHSIQFVLFHKMQIWNFVFEFLFAFVFVRIQINFSSSSSHYLRKFASQLGMFFSSSFFVFVFLNFELKLIIIKDTPDSSFAVSFFSSNLKIDLFTWIYVCLIDFVLYYFVSVDWYLLSLSWKLELKFKQWNRKIRTEHTSIVLPTKRDSVSISKQNIVRICAHNFTRKSFVLWQQTYCSVNLSIGRLLSSSKWTQIQCFFLSPELIQQLISRNWLNAMDETMQKSSDQNEQMRSTKTKTNAMQSKR